LRYILSMPRNVSPQVIERAVRLYSVFKREPENPLDMEALLNLLKESGQEVSYSALYHTLLRLERKGLVERSRVKRKVYWKIKRIVDESEAKSLLVQR